LRAQLCGLTIRVRKCASRCKDEHECGGRRETSEHEQFTGSEVQHGADKDRSDVGRERIRAELAGQHPRDREIAGHGHESIQQVKAPQTAGQFPT
jgi:hypothetical protein